ncbi:hypothetical protein BV20DRAFT_1052126 [Pilatotrama ljubarskyi]|nr:hypothetical protein BV20DRAFT_1052126 [Pilatotrama ljubarskyi]
MAAPMDVFFEIMPYLHPSDLRLARTESKQLRAVLLSRKSRFLWKAALGNVEGLPAATARTICASRRTLRSCAGGIVSVRTGADLLKDLDESDTTKALLTMTAPCAIGRESRLAELTKIIAIRRLIERRTHTTPISLVEEFTLASARARSTRSPRLLSRLSLPSRSFSPLAPERLEDPKSHTSQERYYNDPRTGAFDLRFLEDFLEDDALLTGFVDAMHIVEERHKYYEDNLVATMSLEDQVLMPNAADARALPTLRRLSRHDSADESLKEEFDSNMGQLLADLEEYKERAKKLAVSVLPSQAEVDDCSRHASVDEVLARPYALFYCSYRGGSDDESICDVYKATFREMHEHWRTHHPDEPWSMISAVNTVASVGYAGQLFLANTILEAVGLSRNSPRKLLDELIQSGRLYCACGDPFVPLPSEELNWSLLARRHLRHGCYGVELPDTPAGIVHHLHAWWVYFSVALILDLSWWCLMSLRV